MTQPAILIPAYNPDCRLATLVQELIADGFQSIVVVNDGSLPGCSSIFEAAARNPQVTLLSHPINMGKGAALKTGIGHILNSMPSMSGVVSADADGQHSVADIWKVCQELMQHPAELILGSRQFDKDVPWRSKFGNRLTRTLMGVALGLRVSDTQTGLRGIPRSIFPDLLEIPYNRYEFELEMLLAAQRAKMPLREVPIQTIYLDGNASSHFNPLLDSAKIYFVLFRYAIASILTASVDYLVFFTATQFFPVEVLQANYMARFVALFVNYILVKNLVFSSKDKVLATLPKYLALVAVSGFISAAIISYLQEEFAMKLLIAKILAEALLYLANFVIQRDFIFSRKPPAQGKTDWDEYYRSPYKTAAYSRRIVGERLSSILKDLRHEGSDFELAELGGANSCFYELLNSGLAPSKYHIFDNNELGLRKFLERIGDKANSVTVNSADVLDMKVEMNADIAFSVGLIEHFPPDGTRRAVEAHFKLVKPGGFVVLFFPTPTPLYTATRLLAEMLRMWIFHDERPLKPSEVASYVKPFGELLHTEIIWRIFLTQAVLVVRKRH